MYSPVHARTRGKGGGLGSDLFFGLTPPSLPWRMAGVSERENERQESPCKR